jgi:hypothetical protein
VKPVVSWFTVVTAAWSILAFGAVWYVGFLGYTARRLRKDKVEFKVERIAEFESESDPHPYRPLVQIHETVYLAWVAKEVNSTDEERPSISSRESF